MQRDLRVPHAQRSKATTAHILRRTVLGCRRFLLRDSAYKYTSGASNTSAACIQARMSKVDTAEKVQLTGGGSRRLQSWSATTLRQVGGQRGARGAGGAGLHGSMPGESSINPNKRKGLRWARVVGLQHHVCLG